LFSTLPAYILNQTYRYNLALIALGKGEGTHGPSQDKSMD
jgi:hypothetical protein